MVLRWKLVHWLNLLSEENPEDNFGEDDFYKDEKKKRGCCRFGLSSPSNPKKSHWLKIFLILSAISIGLIIFFNTRVTDIDIKSVTKNGSNKIKITTINEKDFNLTDTNLKSGYVYSENINHSNTVFRIILTADEGRIAFRVSRSMNTLGGFPREYLFGKECKAFSPVENIFGLLGMPSTGGSNGKASKNCKENEACCKGSNGGGGTSSNNGCCDLVKWIDFAINNQDSNDRLRPSNIFLSLLPTISYMLVMYFMIRGAGKLGGFGFTGGGGLFGGGISNSRRVKSKVTFKDVAGIDEVREELEEIVDYLRSPSKYRAMGARGPKGVILYGPPGTGKTLLAKAVSGEANVPFIEASGSGFDDMFVGSGARRVRELFNKARKLSPCIIFIDEIDAVAGKRGNKFVSGGGGGVADQTINQLLSEMDGFNTSSGVVVMAATNRLDALDEAILRPGRFDRSIQVGLPNITGRRKILEIHARNKNMSQSVDLDEVARKTPGFSGAQLENILNEAALMAVRERKKFIKKSHIDEAIDRTIAGLAKKDNVVSFNDKKQVAYHEAGHAVVGLYTKGGDIVEKVTIIPRGKALGYMLAFPEKLDPIIQTKEEILAIVTTTLGGRAAEELFFGSERVGTGASNDLFKVTNLVRSMVTKFGMSEALGLVQYEPSEGMENPYRKNYSDKSSREIDEEVRRIVGEQYEIAKKIILDNKEEYLLIAEALLLMETLDKRQINHIHEFKELPPEAKEIKERMEKAE